jgi:uncharacterized RDD family membrane protein YckC
VAERLEQIDTQIEIVTPENIAFHYQIAGPFRRLIAYLLDFIVRLAIVFVIFIAFVIFASAGFSGMGQATMLILFFLLDWFYGGLFETFWNGQTPGKRVVGLRVMTIEGQPIEGWQAVLRNFLRAADAMPMLALIPSYQVGLWSALCTKRMQRLGDLAAGTMVVVDEPAWSFGICPMTEPAALALVPQLPKNFRASRSLARVLSRYVERRQRLSAERRAGVAWYLAEPLRQKLDLPQGLHPDTLLCALYYMTFITDGTGPVEGDVILAAAAPEPQPLPQVVTPVSPEEVVIRT